jgi:hypothetical protein
VITLQPAQIDTAVRPRDIFAHQLWDWSPEIDGLLFTHKAQARNFSLKFGNLVRKNEWTKITPDLDATLVFTRKDIAEAVHGLNRAKTLLGYFLGVKRFGDPTKAATPDRVLADIWSRLTAEPEIVEGLSALQQTRQTPGSSGRSRRRRKRRSRK